MEILLSREKSSMASTWTEMVGFFQDENGDWVLGNCGYEILGSVYDVSSGAKHYKPGGSYHFFLGKDASRAFVTGDFVNDLKVDSPAPILGFSSPISFGSKDFSLYFNNSSFTYRMRERRQIHSTT
jgi:hypothetical protein